MITGSQRLLSAALKRRLREGSRLAGQAALINQRRKSPTPSPRWCRTSNTATALAAVVFGADSVQQNSFRQPSVSVDFATTSARGDDFDYSWEERWIRDEGFSKIGASPRPGC